MEREHVQLYFQLKVTLAVILTVMIALVSFSDFAA